VSGWCGLAIFEGNGERRAGYLFSDVWLGGGNAGSENRKPPRRIKSGQLCRRSKPLSLKQIGHALGQFRLRACNHSGRDFFSSDL
jgi:hypothetical protein